MRTPFLAGNWKMYKTIAEAVELVRALRDPLGEVAKVDKAVCPPFVALAAVADLLKGSDIGVGAQNMYWEEQGARTGEISPLMLKGLCQYVIIGHSERRQYFGETDETVNKKILAALAHDLTPIVCVGENLAQNEAGETETFVSGQVRAALAGVSAEQAARLVIAYEPIWAIGTGKAATSADANRIIGQTVRGTLADLYGQDIAQGIRIQYGGSVKAANAHDFLGQPEIDGALVGGASLKADEFVGIVRGGAEAKGLL
jgi:triosephosphate isomerase